MSPFCLKLLLLELTTDISTHLRKTISYFSILFLWQIAFFSMLWFSEKRFPFHEILDDFWTFWISIIFTKSFQQCDLFDGGCKFFTMVVFIHFNFALNVLYWYLSTFHLRKFSIFKTSTKVLSCYFVTFCKYNIWCFNALPCLMTLGRLITWRFEI